MSARWRTCISHVDGNLGGILGRFYVEQAFSARDKELGDQIVSDIKKQFIAKLDTLAWVEDSVKVLAKQKVNNIVQKIGYPTAVCYVKFSAELARANPYPLSHSLPTS